MKSPVSTVVASAALLSTALAAIDPIVSKGTKFFHRNSGEQFYIRGIAYQQGVGVAGDTLSGADYTDPLANPSNCRRDVPVLQDLSTNAIRVYAIDPTANHDECMNLLADAGIYVIADLSQPDESINRNDPHWDDSLYNRYVTVIDEMQQYDNVLGFFAGNEVSNNKATTDASAFVKAAVRDMKAYIKAKGYREGLGVGYATNDDEEIRDNLVDYMSCGDDSEAIDFWGYNIYEWCAPDSTFTSSGYADRTEEFRNFDKPAFFAEYGCIDPGPRLFKDTPVIYGPQMNDVFSGGIVYMYFQEQNNYGLVNVNGDGVNPIQPDYNALSSQIKKVTATGVAMDSYQPTNSPRSCPQVNSAWHATEDPLPPSPNPELCQCMMSSLSCVVKSSTDEEDYGKLFKYICGQGDGICDGIAADARAGNYGAYSMCNSTEQLSFVMDRYVSSQSGASCGFNGQAQSQTAASLDGQCRSLVSQAGKDGTGQVTASPTAAGTSDSSSTDEPNSGSSMATFTLDMGLLKMGASVVGAMLTGAGILLL